MRVHLTTTTFDPLGAVALDLLPADTDWGEVTRRANRVATLDGGVVVNDFGFAPGDMTFVLRWVPSRVNEGAVRRLVMLYSRLRLACHKGVFLVVPQGVKVEPGKAALTLLVVEQLA